MKRVIYTEHLYGGKDKFILKKEYENFGIYQEMTPSGFFTHQFWLITNGEIYLEIYSFNHYCMEEVFDLIDNYNETKEFGVKAITKYDEVLGSNIKIMHNSGVEI